MSERESLGNASAKVSASIRADAPTLAPEDDPFRDLVVERVEREDGRGPNETYHLHFEFYPPNRSATKLKYLAGSAG
ncbi:MAG: hypothetical protein M3R05_03105 [Chloroflexota bacterium]|nr:hypothetical protein [Chloroflexota bacterium]